MTEDKRKCNGCGKEMDEEEAIHYREWPPVYLCKECYDKLPKNRGVSLHKFL